jgi:hypothetical protein
LKYKKIRGFFDLPPVLFEFSVFLLRSVEHMRKSFSLTLVN